MNILTPAEFYSEYHKRIIAFHILGMNKRSAERVALYYFANSQYELATRMAEHLKNDPERISDFLKRFPISIARLTQISDAQLRDSLPGYRSFGLKPKICREIQAARLSIIK